MLIALGTLVAAVVLYRGACSLQRTIEDELDETDEQ